MLCCSLLAIWLDKQDFSTLVDVQLRKERDRLRHKMDMFKKTLSSELLTMQLRGSNDSDLM